MRDELVQIKSFTSKLLLAQVGQKTVKKVVMRRPGLDLDLGCYGWSGGSQICLPASLPTGPWPRGPCGYLYFLTRTEYTCRVAGSFREAFANQIGTAMYREDPFANYSNS